MAQQRPQQRNQTRASQQRGTAAQRQTRAARERETRRRPASNIAPLTWDIPWSMQNVIGIGVGIGVIVLGYVLMGTAISDDPMSDKSMWNNSTAVVVAPILLTLAYCAIIPMAIFWRRKRSDEPAVVVAEGVGSRE
jgi:hypothetical protein